mgnify:FL=1
MAKQKLREMHQEMVGLEHSVTNEDTECVRSFLVAHSLTRAD